MIKLSSVKIIVGNKFKKGEWDAAVGIGRHDRFKPTRRIVRGSKKNFFGAIASRAGKTNHSFTLGRLANFLDSKHKIFNKTYSNTDKNLKNAIRTASSAIMDEYYNSVSKDKKTANRKRYLNILLAMVRNPILRKEYGRNSIRTVLNKGFDHVMVATGTFFKTIKARFINV